MIFIIFYALRITEYFILRCAFTNTIRALLTVATRWVTVSHALAF